MNKCFIWLLTERDFAHASSLVFGSAGCRSQCQLGFIVTDQVRIADARAEAQSLREQFVGKSFALRERQAFDADLQSFLAAFRLAHPFDDPHTRIIVIAEEVPTYRAVWHLAPLNAAPLSNRQDPSQGLHAGDVVLFYGMFSDFLDGELWMNRGRVPARQVFADPRGSAFVLE